MEIALNVAAVATVLIAVRLAWRAGYECGYTYGAVIEPPIKEVKPIIERMMKMEGVLDNLLKKVGKIKGAKK